MNNIHLKMKYILGKSEADFAKPLNNYGITFHLNKSCGQPVINPVERFY